MILLVGYGNVMRSDDAAGIYLAKRIAKENDPHVKTILTQQLNVELLEDAVKYENVIFVDASQKEEEVSFKKVEPKPQGQMVSSHHLSPELFLELARTIYNVNLNLHVCSIRGENFELGDVLSKKTRERSEKAFNIIRNFIHKELTYA